MIVQRLLTTALVAGFLGTGAKADEKLIAYGKHIAAECSGCHRLDGADSNIPAITGRPADDIGAAIKQFQTGERTNPAMVSVAQSLDDRQIAALAAYLATLRRHR